MKGLPLAYAKDLQEDKEGTFDALHSLSLCLAAMTGMVGDLVPDLQRMKAAASFGYATATDLADWLVRRRKLPFREAHHIAGRLVAVAAAQKKGLDNLSLAEKCGRSEPQISEEVFAVLGVENCGPQPDQFRRHRAQDACARAGPAMAEAAQKRKNCVK